MTFHQELAGEHGFRASRARDVVATQLGASFGARPGVDRRAVVAAQASRAEELLEDVRRAIATNPDAARVAAARLASLLSSAPVGSAAPAARGGLAPWQKRKVDGYLSAHLNRPLRLEELAEQVALSISHFGRAFKETFGTSPHTHIMRLRVDTAKRLMLNSDDPLSQIASACGFGDQSHLTKLFRRYVGQTPHLWRRSNMREA
jgi:AraC-like DNA-binding protein